MGTDILTNTLQSQVNRKNDNPPTYPPTKIYTLVSALEGKPIKFIPSKLHGTSYPMCHRVQKPAF